MRIPLQDYLVRVLLCSRSKTWSILEWSGASVPERLPQDLWRTSLSADWCWHGAGTCLCRQQAPLSTACCGAGAGCRRRGKLPAVLPFASSLCRALALPSWKACVWEEPPPKAAGRLRQSAPYLPSHQLVRSGWALGTAGETGVSLEHSSVGGAVLSQQQTPMWVTGRRVLCVPPGVGTGSSLSVRNACAVPYVLEQMLFLRIPYNRSSLGALCSPRPASEDPTGTVSWWESSEGKARGKYARHAETHPNLESRACVSRKDSGPKNEVRHVPLLLG